MENDINQCVAHIPSPLGIIEIIGNKESIISILFIETENNTYKSSTPTNSETSEIKKCIQQLNEYFEGTRKEFDLKLKLNGTNFQKKVWQKLTEIKFGETKTYSQQSIELGDIKAIRAVASANGKNKLSIVIPCHRVVGKDGSLTGYAGDIWRKKWLLEHEQKFTSSIQKGKLF